MSTPDLLYSETEEDLRATVRRLFEDRADATTVLSRVDSDERYDLGLWKTIAGELGLAGLIVGEELGGSEASARELAVVAEELGRSVAPVPFLGSAVLATTTLLGCTQTLQGRDTLRGLVEGSLVGTLAVNLTTTPSAEFPTVVQASSGRLTGTVRAVVDLEVADVIVVPARDGDGPALYLLSLPQEGAISTPTTPLDLTRGIGCLELNSAQAHRIATGDAAVSALRRALTTGAAILASEQVGLAQYCLESTVDYLKTRYQFGRPVGSFQALKHRLADLWAGASNANAVARHAAGTLADSPQDEEQDEAELAATLAQAYCSDLAVLAAEETVQLHGGIGMTWEHPAHLYLGRAKSSQLAFGSPARHRARIAELVDLPAPETSPSPNRPGSKE